MSNGLQLPVTSSAGAQGGIFSITNSEIGNAISGVALGVNNKLDAVPVSVLEGLPGGILSGDYGVAVSGSSPQGHGMHGVNGRGAGTAPPVGCGTWGESDNGFGVYGACVTNAGVWGTSTGFDGVHGETTSHQHAGVSGINKNNGPGVYGQSGAGCTGTLSVT